MSLVEVQRAAVELFARHGFAGTGIREVGRAVGMSSAALYHYAPTKQDLLAGVMTACLDALDDTAAGASGAADPAERLARLAAVHVGLGARNPATCRVTDQEVRSLTAENLRAIVARRDRYEARWTAALRAGVEAGVFTLGDARLTRLALLDMCSGIAAWYRPTGRTSTAELQRRYAAHALRLAGADAEVSAEQLATWADVRVPRLSCEPVAVRAHRLERNAS